MDKHTIWLIICSVCFTSFGFVCGVVWCRPSAQIASLHKRGYFIRKSDINGAWRWIYFGFDKSANAVEINGEWLRNKIDAIANAEAHYYATITRESGP